LLRHEINLQSKNYKKKKKKKPKQNKKNNNLNSSILFLKNGLKKKIAEKTIKSSEK
jgi:hypothetical protein